MIRLLTGDCRKILPTLADESVHCVVTSPPYWGLRDYGVDGQLGLETSLGEHVETMVSVFREVRRVLRKDGTLWLNYGDSYATNPNGRSAQEVKELGANDRTFRDKPFSTIGSISRVGNSNNKGNVAGDGVRRNHAGDGYLKPKDLCGIPWRVAFALQADGWWLRQDIIWSKSNPMPESVTDRCTKAHEYIFLLSKSERYYYDADAIKEDTTAAPQRRFTASSFLTNVHGQPDHAGHKVIRNEVIKDYDSRNKRSVWEVATAPFSEAHFATFPPALIEPCILAGCPKGGTALDPFGGAGTTGLVADRLGRNAILIELNPKYAAMAERRIKKDAGMFASLERVTA